MRPTAFALPLALAVALAAGCEGVQDTAPANDAPPTPPEEPMVDRRVPERYQGVYAADSSACGRKGDPSQLELTEEAIAFHESRGDIVRVTAISGGIAVTAALAGEGEAWEGTYRFALSPDGRVLTDLEHGLRRIRCD